MNWHQLVAKAREADWFDTTISAVIEKKFPGGRWVGSEQAMAEAEKQGLEAKAMLRNPFRFDELIPTVYMAPMNAAERKQSAQAKAWADVMKDW